MVYLLTTLSATQHIYSRFSSAHDIFSKPPHPLCFLLNFLPYPCFSIYSHTRTHNAITFIISLSPLRINSHTHTHTHTHTNTLTHMRIFICVWRVNIPKLIQLAFRSLDGRGNSKCHSNTSLKKNERQASSNNSYVYLFDSEVYH